MLHLATTAALLLSAIIFFINKWKKKSKNSKSLKKVLPPGPRKLPIIGNLHQMTSLPFRRFRDLSKQYGSIMHLKLGEADVVVVSSPEIAKEMLKDLDPSYANRPKSVAIEIMLFDYSDIAFSPYGDYWRQMRRIGNNEFFSPKMVRLFESIRRDEAARLVDSLKESSGRIVNLTEEISSFSSSITCRAAFGGNLEDRGALIKLMMESLEMAGGLEIADLFPSSRIVGALSWTKMRLKRMRRRLDVILDDVIEQHKRNRVKLAAENEDRSRKLGNSEFGGEDLVDVFLRVKEEEQLQFPIDNHNIKAVLYGIFTGGTDTSGSTIDWAMLELMRNPRVMAKAQAELRQASKGNNTSEQNDITYNMKYLKLVIKETLRLHPAIPILPRASNEEHVINGYTIPAGAKVMVNHWAMQRDPRYWKDPERFEPERFENQALDFVDGNFQFLPFGTGKRMCPGMTFGLATVELALAQLLYYLEGVRAEDLDMTEHAGIAASRKHNLFVIATPYN